MNVQPQINAQNLIRAFDLRMNAGETIAAPRWTVEGESGEGAVQAEASVPDTARAALEAVGFRVNAIGDLDEAVGAAHLIVVQPDGTFDVGSDPRADGGALAL